VGGVCGRARLMEERLSPVAWVQFRLGWSCCVEGCFSRASFEVAIGSRSGVAFRKRTIQTLAAPASVTKKSEVPRVKRCGYAINPAWGVSYSLTYPPAITAAVTHAPLRHFYSSASQGGRIAALWCGSSSVGCWVALRLTPTYARLGVIA
jgi:hypothetical protein